jgi:hypothetical protein
MRNAGWRSCCRINARQQEIAHIQSDTKRSGGRKFGAKGCINFAHGIISIGTASFPSVRLSEGACFLCGRH